GRRCVCGAARLAAPTLRARRWARLRGGRITPPGNANPGTQTMKIHEYQAKEMLAAARAAGPRGGGVTSAAHAPQQVGAFGGVPVVLKAQVHTGGRGKGTFKGSGKDFGGVKYITTREKVGEVAEVMFKYPLVTKQTGEGGVKVSRVLVQVAADIAKRSPN